MKRFSALLRGSIVVTAGTLVGGVLSYAYSSLMGRLLGPADFGDLGAINSYFVLLTAVGGGLLTVTMYYVSALFAADNIAGIRRFYIRFIRVVFFGSLLLAALAILTAPLAARFFSISDQKSLIFALISIVVSLLLVVNRGVLQGTQRFGQLTVSNIVEYLVKLIAAYALVRGSFGLGGATLAIPVGALGAFVLSLAPLKKVFRGDIPHTEGAYFPRRKEILLYFLPALFSNAALLLLMNMDILLAKKLFEPELAGQYVAISTIAKIIFYITGPITSVMFPLIASQRSKGEKHYLTLVGAGIITVLGSAVILGLYTAFDQKIVGLLYGSQYQALSSLLPVSAIIVILLSLVNLMSQYFLSIQRYWFIGEMALVAVLLLGYSLFNAPPTLPTLLRYLALGFSGLIAIMALDYLHMKRSQLQSFWRKNG